jgi:hypothetical protein
VAWFGNARHPARDQPNPDASGPARGSNEAHQVAITHGPSRQAVSTVGSLGIAVHTGSPMSRGFRTWNGDPGFGVHRFTGRLPYDPASPTAAAVRPVQTPTAVRYGMNYGASQGQGVAYPSTGAVADYGTRALATMSVGQLGRLGMGGGA